MNKGTVIYIGGFVMPDKNPAAHRVISNAKAFRELGYETVFIGVHKKNTTCVLKEKHFGFDVYSKKSPNGIVDWFKFITEFKFYKDIIKKQKNVKAIICYNTPSISISLLARWARIHKVKIIADCTEWYETEKSEKTIKKYVKKIDIYNRMHLVQPKLDAVIAISSFIENFYKTKKTKTIKIPPLTDTKEDKWCKHETKVSNYKNIIYIGTPFSLETKRQKDRIDNIIDALLSFDTKYDFVFHIIGCNKLDFLEFYPNFSQKIKGKEEIIKFYGKLSHKQAIEKLKLSDFSIFIRDNTLTNKAGFPTKFAEAISCGVPVLTNRNSNVKDYLIEGVNGFFIDNNTHESLVKSLEKPLSITNEELLVMKTKTYNSKLFDYRNYIKYFKKILELKI